jgi:hypothetical protein
MKVALVLSALLACTLLVLSGAYLALAGIADVCAYDDRFSCSKEAEVLSHVFFYGGLAGFGALIALGIWRFARYARSDP